MKTIAASKSCQQATILTKQCQKSSNQTQWLLLCCSTHKKVPNYMFANCEKLESVNIPNSVVRIGESAFRECSGLKNISFGNNIQSIYSMAFWDALH